jgi:hypothetical protein
MLRFIIRYKVSVRFQLRFFKYLFYSRIPVLLIFLCGKLKLLLNLGRYITWGQFTEFSRNFKFLAVISGNLISVDLSGFLRHRVDFSRSPGL